MANGRVPPRTPLIRQMRAVIAPVGVSRPRQIIAKEVVNAIGRERMGPAPTLTRTLRDVPTSALIGASRPRSLAKPASAERRANGGAAIFPGSPLARSAPVARSVATSAASPKMRPVTPTKSEMKAKVNTPRIGAGQQTLSPRAEVRRVTTAQTTPVSRPRAIAATTTARGASEVRASATPPQRGTARTAPVVQGGSPRPRRVTPESRVGPGVARPRQAMPHLGPVATRPTSASATLRPGNDSAIARPASAGTPKAYPAWEPREVIIPERTLTVGDL